MAFINAVFPNPRLIHGIERNFIRPVPVVGNGVIESRIQKLKHYRTQWIWPARSMTKERRDEVFNFIMDSMEFGKNSVKFKDPLGSKWNLAQLQYAGSSNLFKLTVRGTDDHPVFHLDSDVSVLLNGSPAAFTKQMVNGVPCIAVVGANAASSVTISGSFFYAVRLNQSTLSYSAEALNYDNSDFGGAVGDIELLEVFEY